MNESMLALIATGLFVLGIMGTIAGALLHHRVPLWMETVLEAEWCFSILGGVFGITLYLLQYPLELPMVEIITVTTVTTIGAVAAFGLMKTGWMRHINDRVPHNMLVFLSIGVLPAIGSLVGEPAAAIVVSALLFGVFHALSEKKKYVLMSSAFATIAIGGLLTTFAAPPVAIAAHRWHLTGEQLREMFLVPLIIAMVLQGLYATWIARGVKQSRAAEDPNGVRFSDFWPIGPKTGMFLIGIVLLANYASSLLGALAFTGDYWAVFIKTGLFTNVSDNGGLAEAAVVFLPHASPAQIYWILGATLSWAVSTLIANAPNIVVAMMLVKAFGGKVNFVKQMKGSLIPLLINVVVFFIYGIYKYGMF